MQDHFSDDKFIEAAKVYKSIQAPSELREKILMGAEEKNAVEVMPRGKRVNLRQVSKALSLAACLAIMVAVMPDWIGEFYAYYQWYYGIPSAEVVKRIPLDFLKKAYYGLHDLELDLAVQKVGEV